MCEFDLRQAQGVPLRHDDYRGRSRGDTCAEVNTRHRDWHRDQNAVRAGLSDGLVDPSSDFPKRFVQSSIANEIGLTVPAAMLTILCQLQ
jgi:hypothetical protein